MRRTHQLRKQYRRAAWLGVGLSVIVHAATFALMRFDVVLFPSPQRSDTEAAALDDAKLPVTEPNVMRMVAIRPVPASTVANAAGGRTAASSTAQAPIVAAVRTSPTGQLTVPASVDAGASLDRMVAVDPLRRDAPVEPIAFTALPAAELTPVDAAAEEAPSYVPGSIGKAKRQWADEDEGDTGLGRGIGWGISTGTGEGHCPVPTGGHGPGRGPLWFVAR